MAHSNDAYVRINFEGVYKDLDNSLKKINEALGAISVDDNVAKQVKDLTHRLEVLYSSFNKLSETKLTSSKFSTFSAEVSSDLSDVQKQISILAKSLGEAFNKISSSSMFKGDHVAKKVLSDTIKDLKGMGIAIGNTNATLQDLNVGKVEQLKAAWSDVQQIVKELNEDYTQKSGGKFKNVENAIKGVVKAYKEYSKVGEALSVHEDSFGDIDTLNEENFKARINLLRQFKKAADDLMNVYNKADEQFGDNDVFTKATAQIPNGMKVTMRQISDEVNVNIDDAIEEITIGLKEAARRIHSEQENIFKDVTGINLETGEFKVPITIKDPDQLYPTIMELVRAVNKNVQKDKEGQIEIGVKLTSEWTTQKYKKAFNQVIEQLNKVKKKMTPEQFNQLNKYMEDYGNSAGDWIRVSVSKTFDDAVDGARKAFESLRKSASNGVVIQRLHIDKEARDDFANQIQDALKDVEALISKIDLSPDADFSKLKEKIKKGIGTQGLDIFNAQPIIDNLEVLNGFIREVTGVKSKLEDLRDYISMDDPVSEITKYEEILKEVNKELSQTDKKSDEYIKLNDTKNQLEEAIRINKTVREELGDVTKTFNNFKNLISTGNIFAQTVKVTDAFRHLCDELERIASLLETIQKSTVIGQSFIDLSNRINSLSDKNKNGLNLGTTEAKQDIKDIIVLYDQFLKISGKPLNTSIIDVFDIDNKKVKSSLENAMKYREKYVAEYNKSLQESPSLPSPEQMKKSSELIGNAADTYSDQTKQLIESINQLISALETLNKSVNAINISENLGSEKLKIPEIDIPPIESGSFKDALGVGTMVASLNNFIQIVNGKNGIEKIEATKNAINDLIGVLNKSLKKNNIIEQLVNLADKGDALKDLVEILKNTTSKINAAEKELSNSKLGVAQEFLENNLSNIEPAVVEKIKNVFGDDRTVMGVNAQAQRNGILEITALVNEGGDEWRKYTFEVDSAIGALKDFNSLRITGRSELNERQLRSIQKMQELLNKVQDSDVSNLRIGSEEVLWDITKDKDFNTYQDLISEFKEFYGNLGELKRIIREVRQDPAGIEGVDFLEAFRFEATGGHITLGRSADEETGRHEVVDYKEEISNIDSLKEKWKEVTKYRKNYYSLLEKSLSDKATKGEIQVLNDVQAQLKEAQAGASALEQSLFDIGSANSISHMGSDIQKSMIQSYNLDVGKYTNDVNKIIKKIQEKLDNGRILFNDETRAEFDSIENKIKEINSLVENNTTAENVEKNQKRIVELKNSIDATISSLGDFNNILVKSDSVSKLITKISNDMKNTAMPRSLYKQFDELREKLLAVLDASKKLPNGFTNLSKLDFSRLVSQFFKLDAEFERTGKSGKNMIDRIFGAIQSKNAQFIAMYFSFFDIIRYIREAVDIIKEYDTALIEMRKVSDETEASLRRYAQTTFGTADAIGSSALQLQKSTADWMRIGESMKEAAESAKDAQILMNVSEFETIDEATKALVSASQAYQNLKKMDIIDEINLLGNTMPVATDELARALQVSAAALSTQGNALEESLALLVAGNVVTQDAEKTGAGLRTISLRIAGTKEAKDELEELGESVDDFVVRTESKTRDIIRDYTAVASNAYQGVDVLDANGNLRSTYEILQDIADIYKEIQAEDKSQGTNRAQALIEVLAGKNRSNIAASVLLNPETLREAYETAQDAEGSALKENEKYMQSIEAHTEQFKNALHELVNDLVDSGFINTLIDFGKNFISFLDKAVLKSGNLASIIAVIASFVLNKKFGIFDTIGNAISSKFSRGEDVEPVVVEQEGDQFANKVASAGESFETQIGAASEDFSSDVVSAGEQFKESVAQASATEEEAAVQEAETEKAGAVEEVQIENTGAAQEVEVEIAGAVKEEAVENGSSTGTAGSSSNLGGLLKGGLISLAIGLVTKLVTTIIDTVKKAVVTAEEAKEITDSMSESFANVNSKFISTQKLIDSSGEKFLKLSQGVDRLGRNLSLSESDYSEYVGLSEKFAEALPSLSNGLNELGQPIIDTTNGLQGLKDALNETAAAAKRDILYGTDEDSGKSNGEILSISFNKNALNQRIKRLPEGEDAREQWEIQYARNQELRAQEASKVNEYISNWLKYQTEEGYEDIYGRLSEQIQEYIDSYINNLDYKFWENASKGDKDLSEVDMRNAAQDIVKLFQNRTLTNLISEINNSPINADTSTISEYSKWYEDYIERLSKVTGSDGAELGREFAAKFLKNMFGIQSISKEDVYNQGKNYLSDMDFLNPIQRIGGGIEIYNKSQESLLKMWTDKLTGSERTNIIGWDDDLKQRFKDLVKETDILGLSADEAAEKYAELARQISKSLKEAEGVIGTTGSTFIETLQSQMAPVMNALGEAYNAIFNGGENGDEFNMAAVTMEQLNAVTSAVKSLTSNEEWGISIDTSDLDNLINILGNVNTTADEAQEAFDDFATSIANAVIPNIEHLTEASYQAGIQALQEMGVVNAEEVLISRIGLSLEEFKEAKEAANAAGINTDGDIKNLSDLNMADIEAQNSLAKLIAEKVRTNGVTIQTDGDIKNLISLAQAAYGTAGALGDVYDEINRLNGKAKAAEDAGRFKEAEAIYAQANAKLSNFSSSSWVQARMSELYNNAQVSVDFDGGNAANSAGSSGSGGSDSDTKDEFSEEIDWIERRQKALSDALTDIQGVVDFTYADWDARLAHIGMKYQNLTDQITLSQQAMERYQRAMAEVGLDEDYAAKVRAGIIDLETITDEALKGQIDSYQGYYDKFVQYEQQFNDLTRQRIALIQDEVEQLRSRFEDIDEDLAHLNTLSDSSINRGTIYQQLGSLLDKRVHTEMQLENVLKEREAIEAKIAQYQGDTNSEGYHDLIKNLKDCDEQAEGFRDTLQEIAKARFDTVAKQFDRIAESIDHATSRINSLADTAEAQGFYASDEFIKANLAMEEDRRSNLYKERAELEKALAEGVANGSITKGSDTWNEMNEKIEETTDNIYASTAAIEKYKDELRSWQWEAQDWIRERANRAHDTNNFMIEQLGTDKLFEKNGNWNDSATATQGLHVLNYSMYLDESRKLAEEIEKIDEEMANDPYDVRLIARKEELIDLQREAIRNANDEKEAIRSLVKEGYDTFLDYLQKAIDKRKEALEAEQTLYEYEKNVRDQAKQIASYQKQLASLSGDTSEENQLRVQQLNNSLAEAQEQLQETQYEKWVSDQEQMMDEMYNQFDELINERLDNLDRLVQDAVNTTDQNGTKIANTVSQKADSIGVDIRNGFGGIDYDSALSGIDGDIQTQTSKLNNTLETQGQAIIKAAQDAALSIKGEMTKPGTDDANNARDDSGLEDTLKKLEEELNKSTTASGDMAYRMYNPNSGQHLITTNANEATNLEKLGWNREGATTFSFKEGKSVTRLYNPNNGDHLYTTSSGEIKTLKALGWNDEGEAFKTSNDGYDVYRLYNPNNGLHHFTTDAKERDYLKSLGWKDEGVAFRSVGKFAKGGTVGKAVKGTGEDGFILARTGEEVLSLDKIKGMQQVLTMFEPLTKLQQKMPNGISTLGGNNVTIGDVTTTLSLPNVTNYEDFVNKAKADPKFERLVQQMTIGNALGQSKLKKYSI